MGRVGRSSERRSAVLCIARRSRREWSVLIGLSGYFPFTAVNLYSAQKGRGQRKRKQAKRGRNASHAIWC